MKTVPPSAGSDRTHNGGVGSPGRHVTCELPVHTAAEGVLKRRHGRVLVQNLEAFVGGAGGGVPVSWREQRHRRLLPAQNTRVNDLFSSVGSRGPAGVSRTS